MKKYHLLNNLTGWLVFTIAAITYLLTIEPTASLWDCGEFIATAYKLEVGHPPGAPLFMMLGRIFSMFAPTDKVAIMVNVFSAICSALTVLFLFWSITHLARKLIANDIHEFTVNELIAILGSGVVGALVFTFSDSFWFSAVEGEVYAASSLFTALVFWMVLKWEEQADEPYANRWLILLAYTTGLSIGVHLLNLLVIPAIVFIYYFRKQTVTTKGIVYTSLFSIGLLAVTVWGIIPWIPRIGSWFELLFVNTWSLPINSGLLFYVIVLAIALIYSVYWTRKNGKVLANTLILGFSMCVLGYGSYAMIVIRSVANPPMEQNAPDNIFSLMSYLNRDQYGSRPLVKGPYYSMQDGDTKMVYSYVRIGDKYIKENWTQETKYDYEVLFPRMFGTDADHISVYNSYVNRGNTVRNREGKYVRVPTFVDNFVFFWDYQLNFMYWRYFLWNFAGRQNDYQASKSDPTKGNWISGISFLDEIRLGDQSNMPSNLAENKGTNKYYFLPLILGLIGLFYQLNKDKKNFSVVAMLFFFTGIAIVIYLNQTPNEPRERDYAYAGSFYAFAIWIGLSVIAIWKWVNTWSKQKVHAAVVVLVCMPVPVLMAQQNWDDHDRSGRYVAADFGYNYLNSCEPQAIVYTFGDNDTFPLWYNQEVEGVRTDLRVANMMYLSADWYYRQMMRRSYESAPLASSATPEKISGSRRNVVLLHELTKERLSLKTAIDFAMSEEPQKMVGVQFGDNMKVNILPAKNLFVPINRAEVLQSGLVNIKDTAAIVSQLNITVPNTVYKNSLAVLDIMANNFPQRPIYYGSSDRSAYMGIDNNLKMEGLAYRLVPEDVRISGNVNIDKTFRLLTSEFKLRGLNDPKVYLDESARRQVDFYRRSFFTLADALVTANDTERLSKLMDKFTEALPFKAQPLFYNSYPAVGYYFKANQTERAVAAAQDLITEYNLMMKYYCGFNRKHRFMFVYEFQDIHQGIMSLSEMLKPYNQPELEKQISTMMTSPEFGYMYNTLVEDQQMRTQ